MKLTITKYVHSCLLVETDDRTALFDPGVMSESVLPVEKLSRLDDIFITHVHSDHLSLSLIGSLNQRFGDARITTTAEAVSLLGSAGLEASSQLPSGVTSFHAPHESVEPLFPRPQQLAFHYLDSLSDPGDSHHFDETKPILALPVTAPWGSAIAAINLALRLKPRHVLPIHDWHWSNEARQQMYQRFTEVLQKQEIVFHQLNTGQPIVIDI